MLAEEFPQDEVNLSGVSLLIGRPGTPSTVYGRVLRLSSEDGDLGVAEGDLVVFREWAGGRWLFNGQRVLVTPTEAVLARVEEEA